MKKYLSLLIASLFLLVSAPNQISAQADIKQEIEVLINPVVPYISVTPAELKEATNVDDLSKRFKTSWVESYKSVIVYTSHKGKIRKENSTSDLFTVKQKENMLTADFGKDIKILIKYIPDNGLSSNDVKELVYEVSIVPHKEATYIGGQDQLDTYLNENVLDMLNKDVFKEYSLSAVKFTVNEMGQVVEANITQSSNDTKTDKILLDAICQMPDWEPASYANGQKEKREFVLSVGDHRSCVVNLLSIKDYN